MTVATEAYLGQVNWTGQTTINPGFSAERATDVHASATAPNGAVTELVQGTQYTVTLGANGAVTINITVANMPPQPQTLTIWRDTPAIQEVDFQDLEDFSADDHEKLHDRWARRFAEDRGIFARALRVPPGEVVDVLPPAAERAGMLLGFDALTGEPVMAIPLHAVVGGGPFFIFNDPLNGLVAKPITAEDLPAAHIDGLGAVKAIEPVTGKAIVGLDEGGSFLLGDFAGGEALEVNVPGAAPGILYNILRAPGDLTDDTLRRVQVGNHLDPSIYLRASGMTFITDTVPAVIMGAMTATGLHGWTIDADPVNPNHNTITGLRTSMFAAGQVRERLTGPRTYFVRKNGNDSNTGLTDDAAGAFLTIQKAIDTTITLDMAGFGVTIRVDGSGGNYELRAVPAAGQELPLNLKQHNGPSVTLLTTNGAVLNAFGITAITAATLATWVIDGFTVNMAGGGGFNSILCSGGRLQFRNIIFGPTGNAQIAVANLGVVTAIGDYAVSGGGINHCSVTGNSNFNCGGRTITITAPVTFSQFWMYCSQSGVVVQNAGARVNPGNVTGQRFRVDTNGTIDTQGGGPDYFPGTIPGSADTASGGVYN